MTADIRTIAKNLFAVAVISVGAVSPPGVRVSAAVHKCADPTGGVVYQDRPCGPDLLVVESSTTPTLTVVPGARTSTVESAPKAAPIPRPRAERTRRSEPVRGDPVERRHLRAGMSEGEVIARIGPPDLTSGKGRRQSRWTWMPVSSDPDTITTVLFDTGRVVEIERTVVKR